MNKHAPNMDQLGFDALLADADKDNAARLAGSGSVSPPEPSTQTRRSSAKPGIAASSAFMPIRKRTSRLRTSPRR